MPYGGRAPAPNTAVVEDPLFVMLDEAVMLSAPVEQGVLSPLAMRTCPPVDRLLLDMLFSE